MMDLSEKEGADIDKFVTEMSLITPIITAQNLCSINSCPDQQMYRARIQYLFQLESFCQDLNGETDHIALEGLIDMVHDAILFASDNSLSYAKSIVFLTIYMDLLKSATRTPFHEPAKLYKKYENHMLTHSVDRPPFSSAIFELADIKAINEFFVNSFFRSLKLIINCLTPRPVLLFRTSSPTVIDLPAVPPLSELEIEPRPAPTSTNESPEAQTATAVPSAGHSSPRNAKESTDTQHSANKTPIVSQRAEDRASSATAAARSVRADDTTPTSSHSEKAQEEVIDRGPEVPLDLLRSNLVSLHEKFVTDFEEKEKQLVGKIKEIEMRLGEKSIQGKKSVTKAGKK